MDTFLLRMMQAHIHDQCHFFLMSVGDVNVGLKLLQDAQSGDWTTHTQSQSRIWYGIQNALIAAANLSKLLWGQGEKFSIERRPLRASLGVEESSPLKTTTMRNHWEHIDERLMKWQETSQRHNSVDKTIGPPSAVKGIDTIDTFRWFDPQSTDIIFWGDSFNLQDITDEVQRIHPLAEQEASRPHWDQEE